MRWLVLVLFLAVVLAFLLAQNGFLTRYVNTIEQLLSGTGDKNDLSSDRLNLWARACSLFLQYPLTGIGWRQFTNYNTYGHEVHNTYLQWLCETGVIGFVFICIPLLWLFLKAVRNYNRLRSWGNAPEVVRIRYIDMIAIGIQLFLLLMHFIDMRFYSMSFFAFFAVAVVLQSAGERAAGELLQERFSQTSF